MTSYLRGPWVIGRLRAALLLGVALAALADLVTFAAVVGGDDGGRAATPGPETVARTVIQAVADDDCDGIDDLLADDADLPASLTRCLAGGEGTAELTGVRVEESVTEGGSAEVTIGVAADGQDSAVVVDLRRTTDDDRWLVTAVRPPDEG